MKRLVIIGASGHGKVIADIAERLGYNDIIFLDDNLSLKDSANYPVEGTSQDLEKFDGDFVVAIGNAKIRQNIQEKLVKAQKRLPVLIHPDAVVSKNVMIGKGTVVMAGTVINPSAMIGEGCIINTCASIDHDCDISNYVHVSVGAHLAGTVSIGERTWIGMGAVVSNNLNITTDCIIGAGSVVIRNLDESGTYVGSPAKRIK